MTEAARQYANVSFIDHHPTVSVGAREIIQGLRQPQKTLEPKWFYDEKGSRLFDRITRLPEYYPTRTERSILQTYSAEIAGVCGKNCVLIEPGSGNCAKVRLLLNAIRPAAYVPVDISADFLWEAAQQLGREYRWLDIIAVCADFNRDWSFVEQLPEGKRVIFYPGSTIGNLEPAAALRFLSRVRDVLREGGGALVGVDLHKSSGRLNAAYNDAEGVTAAFNLNVLDRLNTLMSADFDQTQFQHRAFYNGERKRIEMHLVSERDQAVTLAGERIDFAEGETIHTENSYKYTVDGFSELASAAGLTLERTWLDNDKLFSVHYLRAGPAPGVAS
ncbi:MAG: L-histidine N(alpha)-methyltransferase [Halioglobus sp.]